MVHYGVDTARFTRRNKGTFDLRRSTSDPIVLFSSHLTVAKGVHYFIRAIPKILREQGAHFVFAGAGPRDTWLELLDRYGVDKNRYTFLGYVDYGRVHELYAESDIFVVASLYENLPIRMLEAMSCENAVVASRICAIPEAINDHQNGLLTMLGDVDGLTDSIVMLLEDEGLREKLSRNARQTVIDEFSSMRHQNPKIIPKYNKSSPL